MFTGILYSGVWRRLEEIIEGRQTYLPACVFMDLELSVLMNVKHT